MSSISILTSQWLFFQVVMFNLEIGAAPQSQTGTKDEEVNHNKLEDMIKELATTLKTVKHEQEYMQVRFANPIQKLTYT